MNYKDTQLSFSQLPMYQRTGAAAYKKDIGNIIKACNFLNNPQEKFKSIHIAGTNGKDQLLTFFLQFFKKLDIKLVLHISSSCRF